MIDIKTALAGAGALLRSVDWTARGTLGALAVLAGQGVQVSGTWWVDAIGWLVTAGGAAAAVQRKG